MKPHAERVKDAHVTMVMMRHGGTHLIIPVIKAFTDLPTVEPGKLTYLEHEPKGPVVIFWRDPRNRIVSGYRWTCKRGGSRYRAIKGETPDDEIAAYMQWRKTHRPWRPVRFDTGMTMMDKMLTFVRYWANREGALKASFERLANGDSGPDEAKRIADYLGGENPGEAFKRIYRSGPTYTGKHSDWREWFGPKSLEAWEANGGPELLDLMGYK